MGAAAVAPFFALNIIVLCFDVLRAQIYVIIMCFDPT